MELGEVNSAYVRVMFIGPGGVGKSSLLYRLMKKHLPPANSTQLAKTMTVKAENEIQSAFTNVPLISSNLCAETVTANQGIKSASTTWAVASEDPQTLWREITDKDEIIRELVGYVNFVVKKNNITINDFGTLDKAATSESMSDSKKRVKGFLDNIISEILLQAKKNPDLLPPDKRGIY